jgi:hypothetical protein
MKHPDFDELVGTEVEGPERERLQAVHELLLAAGPPPELPPSLEHPPGRERDEAVRVLRSAYPRRRLVAALALAVVLALAAFGGGYLVGDREESPEAATSTVKLVGTEAAQGAVAAVRIFAADDAGNHAIELTVRGLEALPARGYYELGMTKEGELVASCGFFKVEGDKTDVKLNASYDLTKYDGWAIVAHLPEGEDGDTGELLLTSA